MTSIIDNNIAVQKDSNTHLVTYLRVGDTMTFPYGEIIVGGWRDGEFISVPSYGWVAGDNLVYIDGCSCHLQEYDGFVVELQDGRRLGAFVCGDEEQGMTLHFVKEEDLQQRS